MTCFTGIMFTEVSEKIVISRVNFHEWQENGLQSTTISWTLNPILNASLLYSIPIYIVETYPCYLDVFDFKPWKSILTYRRLTNPSMPIPLKSVLGSSPWKPMSHHCFVILAFSFSWGINKFQSCINILLLTELSVFSHPHSELQCQSTVRYSQHVNLFSYGQNKLHQQLTRTFWNIHNM